MTTNKSIEISLNQGAKFTVDFWEPKDVENDAYFTYPYYDCYGHADDTDVYIDREEAIKLVKALTKAFDITVAEITPY